jgi:hypothetical protein
MAERRTGLVRLEWRKLSAATTQLAPVLAASAGFGIEHLAADCFPEGVGVRRIGEAVEEVPAVLTDERMMPRSQRQVFANVRDGSALSAGASVGGYDDLVREFAIEATLAVLAPAPRHGMTRALHLPEILRHVAEGFQDYGVVEFAEVRRGHSVPRAPSHTRWIRTAARQEQAKA